MPLFTHLLAIATVAIVGLSSLPANANALAADHARAARHIHVHDAVAKRRRDTSSSTTCKPRPSSSPPTSTPTPTPTPTPTLTPTSSPSATPSSSSSKKMGLAWGTSNDYLKNFALSRVGFFQNWDSVIPKDQLEPLGIQGIPLLWCNDQGRVQRFQDTVVAGYATIAGALNEPNEPSQCNLSPEDGVTLWRNTMNPLKAMGYTLHGPCCTDSDSGKAWYQSFFSQCPDCAVDVMCVHLYNTNITYMFEYLNWMHDTFNRPVIVTEFADQDFSSANIQASLDQIDTFAEAMVNFVYSTDWIFAAFPFAEANPLPGGVNPLNALMDPTTNGPTNLANIYFGY